MAKNQADGEGNIRKRNVMMMPVDDDHFTITVSVEVSPTFFAWISTFGRSAKQKLPVKTDSFLQRILLIEIADQIV